MALNPLKNAIGGGLNTLYVLIFLFYLKLKLSKINALKLLFILCLINEKSMYYNINNIHYKNRQIKNKEYSSQKDFKEDLLIIKENTLEPIYMSETNKKSSDYINYKKVLSLNNNEESDDMRLVEYINDKYRGVHITVSLLNQEKLTGEVVKGFDNILLLKVGDILTHVDGEYIVSFF